MATRAEREEKLCRCEFRCEFLHETNAWCHMAWNAETNYFMCFNMKMKK